MTKNSGTTLRTLNPTPSSPTQPHPSWFEWLLCASGGFGEGIAMKHGVDTGKTGPVHLLAGLFASILLTACGGSCDCEQLNVDLASVEIVDGNAQVGPVGQPLTKALVVRLLTSSGTAATGQTVSFAVVDGGGSVSGDAAAAERLRRRISLVQSGA